MAHDASVKRGLRSAYIHDCLELTTAAELAKVPLATARSWKIKDKAGSRYFCESFYGPPCPTSGKNYATAMPAAAPAVLLHSLDTQQGDIQHHSRNDSTRFRKAYIFTTQKDAS